MRDERILYDTHMHTPLCKHAFGEPEEYADVAWRRGLKGIVFTCHNPVDDGWAPSVRMENSEFNDYLDMVERARTEWQGRIDVRVGLESDYLPGAEPWLERLHKRAPFQYVLGSVHAHINAYKARYFDGDAAAYARTYFGHLAAAAESGLFDALAHPDIVKVVIPSEWNPVQMMDMIQPCLDRIAAAGTALELNTSGLTKVLAEMSPGVTMLREMREREIPVVLGSDAHGPMRVAAAFEEALDILESVGYTHTSVFLERQREEIPIAAARCTLKQLK